mgnify:CR=1 FL=1
MVGGEEREERYINVFLRGQNGHKIEQEITSWETDFSEMQRE